MVGSRALELQLSESISRSKQIANLDAPLPAAPTVHARITNAMFHGIVRLLDVIMPLSIYSERFAMLERT